MVNKKYKRYAYFPKTFSELKEIIEQRYEEQGPGTKQNPVNFNDIDTSSIDSFADLFNRLNFEYIDISSWNTSNVYSTMNMFYSCEQLVSIGDIGEWDVSDISTFRGMFFNCRSLETIGDLSNWTVTDKLRNTCTMCFKLKNIGDIGKWEMKNVDNTFEMFQRCDELEYIGDISSWDLQNVDSMGHMFYGCKKLKNIGDLTKWKKPRSFKKIHYFEDIFTESSIINRPDWAF